MYYSRPAYGAHLCLIDMIARFLRNPVQIRFLLDADPPAFPTLGLA